MGGAHGNIVCPYSAKLQASPGGGIQEILPSGKNGLLNPMGKHGFMNPSFVEKPFFVVTFAMLIITDYLIAKYL